MEPNKRITGGMDGVCRFRMKHLVVGLEFTLSQGSIVLGSGVVSEPEECTIDENENI